MKNTNNNINSFFSSYDKHLLSEEAFNNLINIHYPDEKKYLKKVNIKKIKNENMGKISIIIPTHNRLEQLNLCINSICSQTYKNFEIIIIDDCSSDGTMDSFSNNKNEKIKYIRNEKNLGVGLNRQKGYNLASGDFIIFCDDDDYYVDDNYFLDAIEMFNTKPDINIICSNTYIHYEKEDIFSLYKLNIPQEISSLEYIKDFQLKLKKPTSTFPVIFRKKILELAKFSDMEMMNDSSIYLRALMMGGLTYYNNKIIGVYRVHEKNYTLNVKADFTIKNLIEKKYVYMYLKERNLIKNITRWYEKQIAVTVKYFLNGNRERIEEVNKLFNWVNKNVSKKMMLYFKIIYLKKTIRSAIKNENH